MEWMPIETLRAREENERIMVWHKYQKCMIVTDKEAIRNRYVSHWGEIPTEWTQCSERTPTETDADALHCVIVKDRHDTIRMCGYKVANEENGVKLWQRAPSGPKE